MANSRRSSRLKGLLGTDRADRKPAASPIEQPARRPSAPSELSAGAAQEWRRLAPVAHAAGTLTKADVCAFGMLCETLSTERQAREVIEREGMVTSTAAGGAKPHPAVRIMENARSQAVALLAQFGLTPRGRQSIDPAPLPRPTDPASRFFS